MTINQVAGGFQSSVNIQPAPGFCGDFATENPRYSFPAGQMGLTAGTGGVSVGAFAWLQTDGQTVLSNQNTGSPATTAPTGFVPRLLDAVIQGRLDSYGNNIPQGWPVSVISGADLFMTAGNSTAAVLGQKVFAKLTDGSMTTGAAGATISGYTETNWLVTSACLAGELFIATALTPVGSGTL